MENHNIVACNNNKQVQLKVRSAKGWVKITAPNTTVLKFKFVRSLQVVTVIGKPKHIIHGRTLSEQATAANEAMNGKYTIRNFDKDRSYKYQYFSYHYEHHAQYVVLCEHGCFHLRSLAFFSRKRAANFLVKTAKLKNLAPKLILPDWEFECSIGQMAAWFDNPDLEFMKSCVVLAS